MRLSGVTFCTVVAVLLSGAALAPGASGEVGPWTIAKDVTTSSSYPGTQLAVGTDGSATAVWAQKRQGKHAIYAVTRTPTGVFGAPVEISGTTSAQGAYSPTISIGDDGTTAAAWFTANDGHSSIKAAIKPPGGSFGTPVLIKQSADNQFLDQTNLVVSPDGEVTIVWHQETSITEGETTTTLESSQAAATMPAGGSFGAPFLLSAPGDDVNAGFEPAAAITVAPDGTVTAAWTVYRSNQERLQSSTRPPGGSFAAPVEEPGTASQFRLELLSGPDGTTTAVWEDGDAPMVATRPPGGSFGSPQNISAGLGGYGVDAEVGADGTLAVTWPVTVGESRIVRVTTRPPGGSFDTPVDVSATDLESYLPFVGVAGDGAVTAIWLEDRGAFDVVLKSATRPSGGSFSAPQAVGQVEEFDFNNPKLKVMDNGTAITAWTGSTTLNYATDPFARIAVKPPTGEFGEGADLSTASNASVPAVATGPDRRTVAVWKQKSVSGNVVRSATRNASAVKFGEPMEISDFGQITSDPEVAAGADGSATAVWAMKEGLTGRIQAAATSGGSFEPAVNLSAAGRESRNPQVAAGLEGAATAVWEQDDPSVTNIYEADRNPDGSFDPPIKLGEARTNAQVGLSTGKDGTSVAAWIGADGNLETSVRPNGGTFGGPISISAPGASPQTPRVAVDRTGKIIVAWRSGPSQILASEGDTTGSFTSPSLLASGNAIEDLDLSAGGDSTAASWVSESSGKSTVKVAVKQGGGKFGPPEPVSTSDQLTNPRVAVTPDDSVIAVWQSSPGSFGKIQSSFRSVNGKFSAPVAISIGNGESQMSLGLGADGEATAVWQRYDRYIQFSSTTVPFKPDPGTQCPKASPRFKRLVRFRAKGRPVLRTITTGSGTIRLNGSKSVKTTRAKAGPKGHGAVRIRLRKKPARQLAKQGRLSLKVRVTFRSVFDCPNRTTTKRIKVVRVGTRRSSGAITRLRQGRAG